MWPRAVQYANVAAYCRRCDTACASAWAVPERIDIPLFYHGHRFPAEVISCAARCYFRFQSSLRDIEELLFERGAIVTYRDAP
jgi:transposase-like protein